MKPFFHGSITAKNLLIFYLCFAQLASLSRALELESAAFNDCDFESLKFKIEPERRDHFSGFIDALPDGSLLVRSSNLDNNDRYRWDILIKSLRYELDYAVGQGGYIGLPPDSVKALMKFFPQGGADFHISKYEIVDCALFDEKRFRQLAQLLSTDFNLDSIDPTANPYKTESVQLPINNVGGTSTVTVSLWWKDLTYNCQFQTGNNNVCNRQARDIMEPLIQEIHKALIATKSKPLLIIVHCRSGMNRSGGISISYRELIFKQSFRCAFYNSQLFSMSHLRFKVTQLNEIVVPTGLGCCVYRRRSRRKADTHVSQLRTTPATRPDSAARQVF